MKKKFTTIVLALLMTMMFATAGVFAAPEGNDAEKSDYWKVEVTNDEGSPVVIVWSTEDKDYKHKPDAVFNIYSLKDGGEKDLIAKNVMSESAAEKLDAGEGKDEPLVYVYNDKEDAKDKDGKAIPLGYSYTSDKLKLDAESEVIVEKVDEEKADEEKTDGTKADNESKDTKDSEIAKNETGKKTDGSGDADPSKLKSGDTKLTTAAGNYTLSAVGTKGLSPTTAEFTWKMNRALSNGDRIDINGQKIIPRNNGDGTYSWTLVHFDPAKDYNIPVKVIDKNGKTVSNVIKHYLGPYYVVTALSTRGTSPTTAEFTWKMSHPVTDGAKVDINGQKIVPRNNGNGTYSWTLVHFDPAKDYNIPVKVIDKNGRTLSNTTYHYLGPYYVVTALSTRGTSPTTAEFTWKMSHPVTDGAKVDINGQKIVPRNNGNGTYSWELVHFDPTKSYKIPVKVIDKNGRTLSNTTYHYLGTYYNLSSGKTTNIKGDKATLNWKLNRALASGHTFYVNDRKVNPTRSSDGSYTVIVSGIQAGVTYNLPVKIVDASGKTVSNTIYIEVDTFGGTIKTMQVQFTFSENRTLTSYTGGSVTTNFSRGYTTTCTGFENGRYQFYYQGRMYYVNRLSTTNQSIVSSAFDKTYSGTTATNYVNSLGISSSTNYLIWVNTYTQKMYIFYGSRGNWRLVQGPWVVSTGKPTTMTSTGLAQIRQKDYYDRNLYYWNVVSYFSIHGKVSEWVLGYPRSDGCVRNTDDHASYVYYNCPIGTAVYVY